MLPTADSRALLRDALARRLGGVPPSAMDDALPCPAGLSQVEKSAWLALQNWVSDAPLRDRFPRHAAYSRGRLIHLLAELQ